MNIVPVGERMVIVNARSAAPFNCLCLQIQGLGRMLRKNMLFEQIRVLDKNFFVVDLSGKQDLVVDLYMNIVK